MLDDFVKWEDKYSVGIKLIDDQHKQLISFTNELYEGCKTGKIEAREKFRETVKKSVSYVKEHFTTEENLMIKYDYPDYLAHKKEHGDFVKKVLEEVKNFENPNLFVPNRFVRFLREWLLSHIAVSDHKYKDFFNSKGVY